MVSRTVKASFPSKIDRTVASALLLLSSSPSIGKNKSCSSESLVNPKLSISNSSNGISSTVITVEDESSTATASAGDPRLKIVRKKRSKSIWISDCKKLTSGKLQISPDQVPESSDSASGIIMTEVSSCLSSGSSSVSSAQSCTNVLSITDKSRKPVGSNHMGHRAEAILRVLSVGSASEVKIRELLGDSPSTSKALRMLLKLEEVKRFGAGGRGNPYIYMIA
ncbi:Hypothetical predicted protein [Olea europaea subsp. europaea]|uniref:HTH three-helical bundle domain-containing protein n=1 Tax=Olea europaea subsp. europaea TaxID=158383 RepID=A0A8S0SD13_OLEEU|nr:Hypothetical predicted protein [Olea europaea subsp. europaea]